MLFYRVKNNFDYKSLPKGVCYNGGELFTEKECLKYKVNKEFCEPVCVSKLKTHWFFGARFENK